jgi:hypothetical protein
VADLGNEDSKYLWVAGALLESNGDGNVGFLAKVDFEDIKVRMKAALNPRNLWDEKSFGLWAVLYESY